MNKQKVNLIGLVLIFVAVLALVGISAYAYFTYTAISTGTSSQNQPTSRDDVQKTSDSKIETGRYLVINEWEIKIKMSTNDKLLYSISSRTGGQQNTNYDQLGLKVNPAAVTDQNCVDFGADLYRQLVEPSFTNVKIDNYYYFVTGAPGQCSDNQPDFELQKLVLEELNIQNVSEL